jgi:hypothetical protein
MAGGLWVGSSALLAGLIPERIRMIEKIMGISFI